MSESKKVCGVIVDRGTSIAYISLDAAKLATGCLNDLAEHGDDCGKWVVYTIQYGGVLVSVKEGTPDFTLTWLRGFFRFAAIV